MDREAREAAGLALSERLGSPVSKKASSPRPKPAQSRPRSDGARFDERRERTDRPPRFQVRKIRFDDLSVNSKMLEKPVSVIPGIGPQNSRSMAKQGIYTVRDFLYYFPRRYDDYSTFKKVNELEYGDVVTIICNVYSISTVKPVLDLPEGPVAGESLTRVAEHVRKPERVAL